MGKFSAFSLVLLVLLAGAAVPVAALQGGPPEHAGNDDGGPPDHANDGGAGTSADDDDPDDAQPAGDDADDEQAASDGADEDGNPPAHASGGDDGDADSTDSDSDDARPEADSGERDDEPSTESTSDSDDGSSDVVESVLETPDPSEEAREAPPDTASSQDEREQFPFPEETPTSTPEETATPTPDAESESPDTPESPPAPSVDSTPTPDDGGPSAPSSSSTTSGPSDPEPSVDVETGDDETVASVSGVDDDENVSIDLRGPATDGETVAVETAAIGVGDAEPFDLSVTRPTANGSGEPVPGVSLAYFDVETSLDDVEQATLTLEVEPGALPSDVNAEDVQVLRYHDGEWTGAETSTDPSAGDAATITAVTPGFSTFAVALPERRPLEVTGAEVPADQVQAGHKPITRATVANPGERRATESVSVSVDGETVATREVTLDGGESTTVEFDLPAQTAGERSVAVEGVDAGQLQVTGADTATPARAEESGLDVGFGIAAATLVVLSAVGTGLLASRRENWDWRR